MSKKIVIISGPNGAGKTTFAREFLPNETDILFFVNADLIAEGLSPFSPEHVAFRAGRLLVEEINGYVFHGQSFAFETTLSGRTYAKNITEWRGLGYKVKLVFLYLPDVKIAIERVRFRVKQGGHNIPEKTIKRRYEKGWYNFQNMYKQLADEWIVFDNSSATPKLLGKGGRGT